MSTDLILQAIYQEVQQFPGMPQLIVGDLNGETANFPTLSLFSQDLGWNDVGKVASTWGQPDDAPTCFTEHGHQPTVKDYLWACPLAFSMITHFRVVPGDLCPTHATLQLQLAFARAENWEYRQNRTRKLQDLIDIQAEKWSGPPPRDLDEAAFFQNDLEAGHC